MKTTYCKPHHTLYVRQGDIMNIRDKRINVQSILTKFFMISLGIGLLCMTIFYVFIGFINIISMLQLISGMFMLMISIKISKGDKK